jgi:hypothetical protein
MHMGPRLARRASRALPALKLAVVLLAAVSLHARALESPGLSANNPPPRYDNTYAKDFIMDAPWRVVDAQTPIPVTIILKDCDVDDVRELHWIRCRDVTGSSATTLWNHDFDDERIGDDASESDFWTYITLVTEGHPSLPNGTLLTPAALGYSAGDVIALEVSIYYRDDWFNYTETRRLRVHVGSGAFPYPAGWYGGDAHYHTMYTNNIAEFGSPLPAVRYAAAAIGLQWVAVTDHSCDLDETGDGSYSYATHAWEWTLQAPAGTATYVRDVFAHGSAWGGLGADVAELDGPDLRLARAVELNLASIDGDSYEKTLHCLFHNPDYIASPLSGAFGERPVTPSLPDGLDQLAMEGFAYAAHPMYDLGSEWGGIDWSVNGTRWGDEDLAAALAHASFAGLEAFNTRETRSSTDQNDPWGDFDAGVPASLPYPQELLQGISLWDALLREALVGVTPGETPRKVFLAGGSDAHGDFNYATYFALDSYATDNALGKVQTVVFVPGAYSPGNLPPMPVILAAYRAGRSVVTDGPFLEFGVDANGDGDCYDAQDLMPGGDGVLARDTCPPLQLRWASLPEFGPITEVRIWLADATATSLLASFDPFASGEGFAGETSVPLAGLGLEGWRILRAELLTDDGDAGHRAYTNPIWVLFDVLAFAEGDPVRTTSLELNAGPSPFMTSLDLRFLLPVTAPGVNGAILEVLDANGRVVRHLGQGVHAPGWHALSWDGRDQAGLPVAAGRYIVRLRAGSATRAVPCVRLR